MLRKEVEIKWTNEDKNYFKQIKVALGQSHVLIIPDNTKEFMIFSFAFEVTIIVVLSQENDAGKEQPITIFSRSLRDAKLRYSNMEKQAYSLVKSLQSFKDYVLH